MVWRPPFVSVTFVKPVYFGSKTDGPLLGFLITGYEIDDRLASARLGKVSDPVRSPSPTGT